MEKPIQAGMILKTKFVAAGNDKFTEYINYIDRVEAVRNDNFQKYDLFHDGAEQLQQDSWTEGYLTYMENPEKTTGLFTVGKDTLTQQDKQKLKELFTRAQKNNSVMWQTVFSFDNRWLQQNGLYNPLTRQVDARKLKEYTRAAMDKLTEKEALKGSAVWSAAIHYNTEHIHIHIAMVEPIPTRPIKIIDGHEEYKGRFRQSSIDAAKSAAVNRILDQKQENQIINDLIRGKIIGGFQEGLQAPPPDLTKGLRALYSHLPKDRRLWKYNMNAMKPLRPALDRLSKEFIEQYHKEDFQELIKRLNAQQEKYILAYGKGGKSNQFTKQHLNDLYVRMGNAILQELKALDKAVKKAGIAQNLLPLPEGGGSAEVPETEPIFLGVEESFLTELSLEPEADSETSPFFSGKFRMEWSNGYKKARRLLYGTMKLKPDFKEAFAALSLEATKGNVLAMDDLGKMFAYGMGREIDPAVAYEWYSLALKGFLELYPENQTPYLAYRIGKHYHYGLGTEIDYTQAAKFFKIAADQGNQFAQYSLAGLYRHGKGVEKNLQSAYYYYGASANQGNAYAVYELAKMERDGIGTPVNTQLSNTHFKIAYQRFSELLDERRDDNLLYRVGQMAYTGTGTDINKAYGLNLLEKACDLGNIHAKNMLTNIYLKDKDIEGIKRIIPLLTESAEKGIDTAQFTLAKCFLFESQDIYDLQKAMKWFTASADQGNQFAQYSLGKLFLDGKEDLAPSTQQAVKWLTLSADQGNQFAQYSLGKLFLDGREDLTPNTQQAVKWLTLSADQGNQFAQYSLGKLFLNGKEDLAPNTQQAVKWLTLSADQGNQFAQYSLGKLYYYGKGPIAPNAEKAYLWLSRSAEQGNLFAKALLEKETYQYQEVKQKVKEKIGYLLSRLFKNLGNERDKRYNQMVYEHMEQQLRNELEQ